MTDVLADPTLPSVTAARDRSGWWYTVTEPTCPPTSFAARRYEAAVELLRERYGIPFAVAADHVAAAYIAARRNLRAVPS